MELVTVPNYTYVFRFEKEFEYQEPYAWMRENWTVCFYYIGAYMILVFGGQHFMQSRPRFELRGLLVFWNFLLALFSIMGTCRTLPEMVHTLWNYGFYHSVCLRSYAEANTVSSFWTWAFVLSKVPELGDTVFIILRKQPLIFLHWYHHASVLIYTWYSYSELIAPARWFVVMNYIVHSTMYSYYGLKALRYNVPKSIAMVITALQLTQMIIGCYVNVWAYQVKTSGETCLVSFNNLNMSLLMYASYFVLFARFFYKAYFAPKKQRTTVYTKEGQKLEKNGSIKMSKID